MNIKHIFIFCSLLTSTLFHTVFGMKTKNNYEIITPENKPTSVAFMQNNTIIITELNSFSVHNYTTKKTFSKEIETGIIHDIATNNKKNKFALSTTGALIVYNSKTKHPEWKSNIDNISTTKPISIAFNSQDDDEIISLVPAFNILQLSNGLKNKFIDTNITNETTNISLCCNPKKPIVAHPSSEQKLTIINYETLTHTKSPKYYSIVGASYSPDGQRLAIMNRDDLGSSLFIEINDFTEDNTYKHDSNKLYISMAFHPNNQALALLTHDNKIYYLNYHTGDFIKNFKAIDQDPLELHHSLEKRLSFSPDGRQLLVALKNKCLILPVPFNVRYEPEAHERLWTTFYSLKKYADFYLPSDIINVITEKLIEAHKYPLI